MLDLPVHSPALHGPIALHHSLLSDAPRILACLHLQASAGAAFSVHVVCAAADKTPAGAPAVVAYVVQEAYHGGARFAVVTAAEPSTALAASHTALQRIADLNLDSLPLFGLPEPAVAAADSVLPSRGYARCSHTRFVGHVLRGGLSEAVLQRGREEAARLAGEGYSFGRLRREDAGLVDSLWPHRSNGSLPFIRDRLIGGAWQQRVRAMPRAVRWRGLWNMKTADAPRLLACLHRQRQQRTAAASAGAPHTTCAVHVVCAAADDAPVGAPAVVAYVLSEESNHAGPRFGMVTAGEPLVALAASHTALQCIADLNMDSLRFFGLPEHAVAAADLVLPPRGYARCSHNPCIGHVLRGGLSEVVLQRGREEAARLAGEGYSLGRLQPADAELMDSLWPYRSAWSLPFIRDRLIGGGLATACARDATGSLVAWAVEYEDGSFGMLTTLDAHRRRGLARAVLIELLTQLLSRSDNLHPANINPEAANCTADEGNNGVSGNGCCTPFAYVVETNTPSRALLLSLGFEETGVFSWQHWERRQGPSGGLPE